MRNVFCLALAVLFSTAYAFAQEIKAPDYSAYILTPKAPDTPRINGPKVCGGRPGADFLYRIPATGVRPMIFAVDGLPKGLKLDESTGIITGKVKKAGTYVVTLKAENILSVAHHFKYGDFDWFAGGDCQYIRREQFEYLDIETPIAEVMGKVEGMKANHHTTKGTNSNELLSVLRPDFVIAGTWKDIHPNHATVKRFFKASPDIDFYTTNLTEGAKEILAGGGVDWTTFAGTQGHVVVKVAPGGEEYKILVLDDSDQEYRVKSISQPLVSSTHF